jgi:LPXTG-motif cell wall-anchored protein
MKKAIFAFALALGTLGFASPAQATETEELPKPAVSIQDGCNDTTIVVTNPFDKVSITVKVADGDPVTIAGANEKTITVSTMEAITVDMKVGRSWVTLAEHTWTRPAECNPHVVPTYTCDDWSLMFVNPKSLDAAKARFTVELDPIVENVKLVWNVKPGMTETLNGLGKGIKARVKVAKGEWVEYVWVKPEKGCEPASPTPTAPAPVPTTPAPGAAGGDNGKDLPLTGVSVPAVAGLGVLLLAAGGVLVARRRRTSFTA